MAPRIFDTNAITRQLTIRITRHLIVVGQMMRENDRERERIEMRLGNQKTDETERMDVTVWRGS